MEHQEVLELLKKQLYGTIKHPEFIRLKQLFNMLEDAVLEQCMYDVWQDYSTHKRNKVSFERVKRDIKRILQPKKQKVVPFTYYLQRIAAVVLLPLMVGFGIYYFTKRSTINELADNTYSIETLSGERSRLVLPDGTRVMINSNSSFTYSAAFGKKNREVNLLGEAYFEVTHNSDLPFTVKSRDIVTKVLGTKFNLYAYPDEKFFEASLINGSVEVRDYKNPPNRIVLVPNEKVRYDYASQRFEKSKTDLRTETAWTRGELYFQSESLSSILLKLERFYGVSITTDGNLPDEILTASFRETDINDILRNLSIHYSFRYNKKGDNIHLRFN
jgi:ferric-dicitrate binding protein FerR (iron transport regulator)